MSRKIKMIQLEIKNLSQNPLIDLGRVQAMMAIMGYIITEEGGAIIPEEYHQFSTLLVRWNIELIKRISQTEQEIENDTISLGREEATGDRSP